MNRLLLILALCLGFAAPDADAQLDSASAQLDIIAAVVDDDVITGRELGSALGVLRAQIEQSGNPLPPQDVLVSQVLERLILRKLQLRAAERMGVVVDDQTINAAMADIARQNKLSLSDLRQALERDGISFAEFREGIRQQLLTARLRQRAVDSRIQVSEQEVDNWLVSARATQQGREYRLAQILIGLPEGASPAQIQASREQAEQVLQQLRQGADFRSLATSASDGRQALEGGDLGWRTVDRIPVLFVDEVLKLKAGEVSNLIRSPAGFHIIKLSDVRTSQELRVNQTLVRHILITPNEMVSDAEARTRLVRLRERIVNGEDFAALAKANSNDPGSAARGGDLGWISPGKLVARFEEEMNQLEPGELSQPFQTRFGWHLIQVQDRRQEDGVDEGRRAAAREALFKRKSEEEWELWLRRLRDEAYVEVRL